jgi:hypothetical protein
MLVEAENDAACEDCSDEEGIFATTSKDVVDSVEHTYTYQNIFLRHLGTYKCQNKLTGDQEMNNITYESQRQQLSRKLFDVELGLMSCLV